MLKLWVKCLSLVFLSFLKPKLCGPRIAALLHLETWGPDPGSGLSANCYSWEDTKEVINSMHVLAVHISLVNLSRQIKVQDLYGKKPTVSHKEAVPAPPLQFQPPLAPRGAGSDSSLLCFVELLWAQDPCYLRRCSWLPPRQKRPSAGYSPPTGSRITQLTYLSTSERLDWRLLEKNQWRESSKAQGSESGWKQMLNWLLHPKALKSAPSPLSSFTLMCFDHLATEIKSVKE